MMQGRLRPARTLVRLPLLVPGFCETDDAPLSLLHDIRRRLTEANSTVSDISICTPNAFLDVPGLGVTVLATTNGEAAQAEELALGLADAIWCMRDAFDYPREPLASVFDRIAASGKRALFAVADLGDVVLAGAPGDSVTILDHVANRHPGLKGAIPVFDAEAVAIARTQGIGTTVDLMVGAKHTPGQRPFHLVGKVRSLGDGRFTARGKYMRKVAMDLGPTAVVRSGNLDVLLTGRPGFTQDPEAFESQGIPLDGLDFVVVKSANHFKLSFSGLATPLAADTPGLTRFDPLGSGHRRSRPLHPFDPDATMAMIRYTFPPRAFESARA
jgi:microcystin degradation protein MlrC